MMRLALLPAVTGFLMAGALTSQAAIIADFSGGEGTTSANQYRGTAGEGWTAGWSFRTGSGGSTETPSTTVIKVENTAPLTPGGGNYLKVAYQRYIASGSNRAGVARPFATSGETGVDVTQAYTISFDFRVDSLTGWDLNTDQIAFSSESTTTIGSFASTAPWALWLRADEPGWQVRNGNGAGGGSFLDFADIGLDTIEIGAVYSITVEMDPLAGKYDLTISVGNKIYRASQLNGGEWLGFGGSGAQAAASNVLQFRATMSGVGDEVSWSMDNIRVASIPEPGSVALGLGGLAGVFWMLRRRKTCRGRSEE